MTSRYVDARTIHHSFQEKDMPLKRLAALFALAFVCLVGCGPPAIVPPGPFPTPDEIAQAVMVTWAGLLPDPGAPSGNGTPWRQRTIDCTVVADRPSGPAHPGVKIAYHPVDGFAFLFPHEWYLACMSPNGGRIPHSAVRTLKNTGEPNDPSQQPVMTCLDTAGPPIGSIGDAFRCEYSSKSRANAFNSAVWGKGYVQVTSGI